MRTPIPTDEPELIRERDRICAGALEMYERGEIKDGEAISAAAVAKNGRPLVVVVLTGRQAEAVMNQHIAHAARRTS